MSSTTARILPAYRDTDPELGETKIDYGLFLSNPSEARLASLQTSLTSRIPLLHLDLPDGPYSPLAVSIATKSLRAGVMDGSTQLANWARAHLRHLESVTRPALTAPLQSPSTVRPGLESDTQRQVTGERVPTTAGVAPKTLPVLPLISVLGHTWSISFAQRTETQTVRTPSPRICCE